MANILVLKINDGSSPCQICMLNETAQKQKQDTKAVI